MENVEIKKQNESAVKDGCLNLRRMRRKAGLAF